MVAYQVNYPINFNFYDFRLLNFVDINILLDDIKIDPFESAFGISSGLSDVKVFGDIIQDICASFRTHKANVGIDFIKITLDQTLTMTVSLFFLNFEY